MKSLALALALVACSTDTFTSPDGGATNDAAGGKDQASGETGADSGCSTTSASCPANAQCTAFDDTQGSITPFVDESQNGGSVTAESDEAVTCPHGLAAHAPQAGANAQVRGAIGGGATPATMLGEAHARVELDIFLPTTVTGATSFVYMLANDDTGSSVGFEWAGGFQLHDYVTNDVVAISPRVGAWNHVSLDVTFSASNDFGKVELDYVDANGQSKAAIISNSTAKGGTTTISKIGFIAGVAPVTATNGAMTVYLDDVAFSPF